MGVAVAGGDDSGHLTWVQLKMLEALRREQAARTERQRAEEARDRAEWIEGIRRRLGLVSEVHECRTWQVGEDYWMWACERPGCPYGKRGVAVPSKRRAGTEASEHSRRYLPSQAEAAPGAGLDLTGWGTLGEL